MKTQLDCPTSRPFESRIYVHDQIPPSVTKTTPVSGPLPPPPIIRHLPSLSSPSGNHMPVCKIADPSPPSLIALCNPPLELCSLLIYVSPPAIYRKFSTCAVLSFIYTAILYVDFSIQPSLELTSLLPVHSFIQAAPGLSFWFCPSVRELSAPLLSLLAVSLIGAGGAD